MRTGRIHIGTSGWHYPHWRGPFYPASLRTEAFLSFYAGKLGSVEINNTFYHLPKPASFTEWRNGTPPGFVFACKASRYITHMKKLKDPTQTTRRFFDGVARLGDKLGPILYQLPPHWRADPSRLAEFLAALPRGFRHAFEFRDESWLVSEIHEVLARYDAACCLYDFSGRQSPIVVTARFVYIRLHGPDGAYQGSYDARLLRRWCRRITAWRDAGLDVYCYFDNDEAGHAPLNALSLAGMVAESG